MPDFSGLFGNYTPPAAPTKTPYDLNSDPSIVLAKALQKNAMTQLQQQYDLKAKHAAAPYIGSGGGGGGGYVPTYAAQLAAAKENAQVEKDKLAHDLPAQLRAILNQLAAHGLSRSGDAEYLPGEANYQYNFNVAGVDRGLRQTEAQIAEQQANAAAANAASASANSGYESAAQARYAQNQQQELEDLQLWLNQSQGGYKQDLAKAYVAAYQQALQNPSIYLTSTGNIGDIINQALGQGG